MSDTPRKRLISALQFEPYEGRVPHLELEFHLAQDVFGERNLHPGDYEALAPAARRDELVRNARLWGRLAAEFDHSVITGIHWLPVEAQIESFGILRELFGDRYMLSAFVDNTISIADNIEALSARIADDPDSLFAELEERCKQAEAAIAELVAAGAEIVFMCSDYCSNQGPLLSPRMMQRFVTPFLRRQVDAAHAAGAFAVKHSDGNIFPILDQLLDCYPDAIHSLDPQSGIDIREARKRVGDTTALIGNVDCTLLQLGGDDDIQQSARHCLEFGALNGTGYVYSSSNCIFEGIPLDSYLEMLGAREHHCAAKMKRKGR